MAIASGPQVEINVDRLPDGQSITTLTPWQIWQTTDDAVGKGGPAMQFYQPNMQSEQLMRVYDNFEMKASETLGIPNYVSGGVSQLKGAGNTASGLSMLMNNASKGLKQVVKNLDGGIVVKSIEEEWLWIMLYDTDNDIKGDIDIVARASEYLIMLEQLQVRRNEALAATNNPTDLAIMGRRGRAAILREVIKGLKINSTDVVPDDEAIVQQEQAEQQMAIQQQQMSMMAGAKPGANKPGQKELGPAGEPMAGQDFNLM
jgi:hypothetical protein